MKSLRQQLSRGSLLVLSLMSLCLWAGGRWAMDEALLGLVGSRLQHDAESVLAAITENDGQLSLQRDRISGVYRRPLSGHYYTVHTNGEAWRSRSLWDQAALDRPKTDSASALFEEAQGPAGQHLLVFDARYQKFGQSLHIVTAENIAPLNAMRERFDLLFIALTLIAMAAMLWLQRQQIKRTLNPISDITEQLHALAKGQREQINAPAPAEIAPLIDAVNRLAEALLKRLQRSRHLLGDMAHALKTPLNLLRQDIETVKSDELRAHLKNAVQRISQLLERELRKANIAGSGPGNEPWKPQQDIADLITVLARLYPEIEFEQAVAIEQADTLDRDDMLDLCGNLLENAGKWAKSRVCIRLDKAPGRLVLHIEDDGPGIAPSHRQALIQRGERLDQKQEGYGLGLSIVREIVASYGGELQMQTARSGGLLVIVNLPDSM